MYFATIKTFNNQMNPLYRLHAFATAEDRDAFVAADGYNADHAHRHAVAATPLMEERLATMTRLSEVEGALPDDMKTQYGADHRCAPWSV